MTAAVESRRQQPVGEYLRVNRKGELANVIDDHEFTRLAGEVGVVQNRPWLRRRDTKNEDGAVRRAVYVEDFNGIGIHLDAGLLAHFASGGLLPGFIEFNESTRKRQFALVWRDVPPNGQHAVFDGLNEHGDRCGIQKVGAPAIVACSGPVGLR